MGPNGSNGSKGTQLGPACKNGPKWTSGPKSAQWTQMGRTKWAQVGSGPDPSPAGSQTRAQFVLLDAGNIRASPLRYTYGKELPGRGALFIRSCGYFTVFSPCWADRVRALVSADAGSMALRSPRSPYAIASKSRACEPLEMTAIVARIFFI